MRKHYYHVVRVDAAPFFTSRPREFDRRFSDKTLEDAKARIADIPPEFTDAYPVMILETRDYGKTWTT